VGKIVNCLFTLNISNAHGFRGPFITPRVRKSFIDACFRWGCNYAEINHDPDYPEARIVNWGKINGPKLLVGYEKLLYLDGDAIISEHAPNPFDLCQREGVMYAVADGQGVNADHNECWRNVVCWSRAEEIVAKHPHLRPTPPERYFNTGFMLFRNTAQVRELFALIDQNRDLESLQCCDQTVINMFVHHAMRVELLPEVWNYIVWARPPNSDAYINHYPRAGPTLE